MDSDSSDWGSDCVVQQIQQPKPLIVLEKQSNRLDFHNDLLINQYESLRSPTFTQSTQISLNFTLNRNSKFITELNIIQNIMDNLSTANQIELQDIINIGFKDRLTQLYLYVLNDQVIDLKQFLPLFTQVKILLLTQDDLTIYLNIFKLLVKYCDKSTITFYTSQFQYIIGLLQSHKFQMYAKAILNISLLDNIDLLSDDEVKHTTVNIKHIMNECFLSEDLFKIVVQKQQYVLILSNTDHRTFFEMNVLFEIIQALVCIINYVSPVTFKELQDDFLLRVVRRYILKQKPLNIKQKSQLASSSLDSDIEYYTIKLGDKQLKFVEAIGNSLSCCSLLLSMTSIRYPVEILQNLLFPCELASQYIKDFFSNQESDTLVLTDPLASIQVYQSIEILSDLSQAGFYSLNVLQQIAQNIEGFNQLKVSLIRPLLLTSRSVQKFLLIQQIVSLLQDLGDYDSILEILLSEYKLDKSEKLSLFIADAFAQILQFSFAQYFYCQALSNTTVIHDIRTHFDIFNIEDLYKFPKTIKSLEQLKDIDIKREHIDSSENDYLSSYNTVQVDLDISLNQMDIYFKRVESYIKANKIQSAIIILQQLIEQQQDKEILIQLQSQLCRVYIKHGCNSVYRVKQQFTEFENSIVDHLNQLKYQTVIDSIQYFLQFLLKNQQYATTLLICQLLKQDTGLSEKQKTLVLLYEVHALSYMNGYNISFYANQTWNENLQYPLTVVENLFFGKQLLHYLILKANTNVLTKAYSMIFSVDETNSQLKFMVQDKSQLIGLFINSTQTFLQKSSYQINIDKIIELKIQFLHVLMDKQKQDGQTKKIIKKYYLDFSKDDGFTFQSAENYIIDSQVLKKIVQSLSQRPCLNLIQNLHILILYIKYWLINDPKNPDISTVFAHCIEIINSTFLLTNNVVFVIYPSKLSYLYQIYQILQQFLELILISKYELTEQVYNLIDAYVLLEKQISNTQTHEFWPELLTGFSKADKKQQLNLKKERLFTHSFMPEILDFYDQDDSVKSNKIDRIMSQIIKIYDNLILQQQNYKFKAKSYSKRQRILTGDNDHLIYTIYEENPEILQFQANEFYKQQIQQYYQLIQELKLQFKQLKVQDYKTFTQDILIILKINNFLYCIQQYRVQRIFELFNYSKILINSKENNQTYYSDVIINQSFETRQQINVSQFIQLLTMLNTTCRFPYDPECLLNNYIDIPLNKTAHLLIIDYLQKFLYQFKNFTKILISFQLQFLPFEQIFKQETFQRVISLQNAIWQTQNRALQKAKVQFLIDIVSTHNRSTTCTIKENQIFKIKQENKNIFGSKFKGQKQIGYELSKYFYKYVPKIIIHQSDVKSMDQTDVQRRFYNKQNLILQFGSTCTRTEYSYSQQQLFLFRNELLMSNKKQFLPYFSKLQKKVVIFDQYSIGFQQGILSPNQQLQQLQKLEIDESFVSLINNSQALSEISLDTSFYSTKQVDVHLFTLADYNEMTDTVISLFSRYQCQLLIFCSGRDYYNATKILTEFSIQHLDFDEFCNNIIAVLQNVCKDTLLFFW
ncbi:hypothetical protein SS50377_22156 [Spironucleus salmonicida]|uniref:Uncharacterized protein n=1 Tax=Spironucleus salmonicida TaxID=348837 RepID=V6LM13_9EUKA|nr:hypothetical protein SS50377_22156 [Spironucleus salmonicida]|eukprot:EST45685.1 Hypothetical protein SS50377_14258 [Spironucleus salmonicida]